MKGHIRERSPGRWAIILDTRDPQTGKRKRKWHRFEGTKRQAQDECARLITEMRGGVYLEPSKTTIARYLDRWLAHIKPNVTPKTHERYTELATRNLVPLIGAVILTKLQSAQVSEAYAKALINGRADGKGGLSARTVHHLHPVLNQALRQAMRWGLLVRNPADLERKDRPKVERKPVATIDAAATADVMDAAREGRLFIPILLGTLCGLRRGEITALRWKSIDLERAQLAVIASTEQTKAGTREKDAKGSKCRTIALPAMMVTELRRHRAAKRKNCCGSGSLSGVKPMYSRKRTGSRYSRGASPARSPTS
jgi:integrase